MTYDELADEMTVEFTNDMIWEADPTQNDVEIHCFAEDEDLNTGECIKTHGHSGMCWDGVRHFYS